MKLLPYMVTLLLYMVTISCNEGLMVMKNIKNISQYDNTTGELLDGVLVYCGVKSNPYGGGWIMNSQEALIEIAKDKDLQGRTLRVFLYLCGILDFHNLIQIPQIEICKELDLKRSHVSLAIKILVNKNIILQGPKLGRSFAYRLNPDYGWKGKVKNLNEYRKGVEESEKKNLRENHLKS